MSNYHLVIGCEVHTELLTNSKMFSNSKNSFTDIPNVNINEIDLGLPGTMPSVNKAAVLLGIKLARVLNMNIQPILVFDRKNYFYQDLPKGFQITQQYFPIGKTGSIELNNKKLIHINRIHLEEDTAKQIKENDIIKLDFNRSGVPLLEIVSEPNISSKEECIEYLDKLRKILIFNGISDGKMENGSFRVDLNISISKDENLGTKVEIKNINSFNNISKAIDFEINRQEELLNNNGSVAQETRCWNEQKNETISMRSKENSVDYKYFTEPNIVNINIENEIGLMSEQAIIFPAKEEQKLHDWNLNDEYINVLMNNIDLWKLFMSLNMKVNDASLVANWLVVELAGILNHNHVEINSIDRKKLFSFFTIIQQNKINSKQCKDIFPKIILENVDPISFIESMDIKQIDNQDELKNILQNLVEQNETMIKEQYANRPERVEKFILGMLMKETKGQANPVMSKQLLDELLAKYK